MVKLFDWCQNIYNIHGLLLTRKCSCSIGGWASERSSGMRALALALALALAPALAP